MSKLVTASANTKQPDSFEASDEDSVSDLRRIARKWITVPPILALDFLVTFSRLEYALKVTTFRQGGSGEAKANWEAFSAQIAASFNPKRSVTLNEAFHYVTNNPPRYLHAADGVVSWKPLASRGKSDADTVLFLIKQVRHNLFHGGKFAHDDSASTNRDQQLIEMSLVLIGELVSLNREVETAFRA
jgi:hypothetical protein